MGLGHDYLNSNSYFLAKIVSVDHSTGYCTLQTGQIGVLASEIVVAHPYGGQGWGIFCGIGAGDTAICFRDSSKRTRIVAYLPNPAWLREGEETPPGMTNSDFFYPRLSEGEIVFQSKVNAKVVLNKYGDVILETPLGNHIALDSTSDTFDVLSAQRVEVCEAYSIMSGAVKRDIRSVEEKLQEPLIGSASSYGLEASVPTEFIGFNPKHKPDAAPALDPNLLSGVVQEGSSVAARADLASSFSNLPKGLADLSLGETGSSLFQSDSVNPPLTEMRMLFYEFADSNVGLDSQKVPDELRAVGKFDNNVLGRKVIGTHVNEVGKILAFDYGFGDGQAGHGKMWNTLGTNVHTKGQSTDDFFDRENTLVSPKGELRDQFEWTIETLERTDAATMFDYTLRTRGVDHAGVAEKEKTGGVNWFVRVAKDGLTKLNIPAATSLNSKEFFREGRSLLANFDGSIEATVGKQLCTKTKGLDRVAGSTDSRASFVNMNGYPFYGRKDRSIALDLKGNLEALIGGDSNTNQSVMIQADGSLAAFFGKEIVKSSTEGALDTVISDAGKPLTTACMASDRKDRSITIRTLGNVEAHINKDLAYGQSIIIATEGGNTALLGKDIKGRSLDIQTAGGIRVEVQGAMSKNGYAVEIDLEGNMHVYVNGKVDFHSTGDMRFQTEKNLHLDVGQNLYAKVGQSVNWTIGKDKIEAILGSSQQAVALNRSAVIQGKDTTVSTSLIEMKGSAGVNIDGGIINLNTQVVQPPAVTPPIPPQDIYMSTKETVSIPVGDNTQTIPPVRASDITGVAPVTKQLEEIIDPKTQRFTS